MKSSVKKAVVFVVLLAAAGAFWQWREPAPKATAAPGPAPGVPVMLTEVVQKSVPLRLTAVGRAEPYSTVTLRPRIDGQIMEVRYKPGDPVKKGQVMVTLDPRIVEAQVRQAEANLARDRAQYEKAVSDVDRYGDLLTKGFVSAAQVDAYKSTAATLAATLKADEAALDLARTQLSYTKIQSPMDGIAGATLAHPGAMVKANDTNLVVINQLKPMYVTFSIPESQLREIERDRIGARLAVDARAPSDPGPPARGELVFMDNAVDATTGTIQLKALLPNADGRFTSGQFVEVAMTLRMLNDALIIPSEALQSGPQGNFVYVAKPDNTVEVRRLATLPLDNKTLIVREGLKPGERVVTDGQLRLTPGARVEVRQAKG
jgi:multidrug efflux system membrane fusion protein